MNTKRLIQVAKRVASNLERQAEHAAEAPAREEEARRQRNIEIQLARASDPSNRHDPQPGIVAGSGYPLNKRRLDGGQLRMVTARRARTLKKRGVAIRWSGNLGWYTWRME
jgi:hypothetical protein